jgi:YesN/AraC family two-component response regulator
MITASGGREYDYVIKKLGASEYIIKPLSKKMLSDIINKY